MHITSGDAESEFERTMKKIKNAPSRNLMEENANIADIKKFQVSFQDVKLPKELSDKFKNM